MVTTTDGYTSLRQSLHRYQIFPFYPLAKEILVKLPLVALLLSILYALTNLGSTEQSFWDRDSSRLLHDPRDPPRAPITHTRKFSIYIVLWVVLLTSKSRLEIIAHLTHPTKLLACWILPLVLLPTHFQYFIARHSTLNSFVESSAPLSSVLVC